MSSKRRASSTAMEDDVMDDSTPEQSPIHVFRKRKRLDPSELCQQLYDSVRNIKKEDGSMLCDTFIRAPKRRQEPSYYNIVANPIDLLKIQQKLKTDSYEDVEELSQDFGLLVNNAKAFYRPDSTEYQDACTLWQYVNTNKTKILESAGFDEETRLKRVCRNSRRSTANESELSECSGKVEEEINPYEELFVSVMTATDPIINDRPLHKEFQLLPSKKIYPDYYDVIEHPIDLRLIATKIQTNAYSNLSEMEKDLLQMTKNACQFNEPGSQIYKDAKTLKKIFTQKKIDLENGRIKSVRRNKNVSSSLIAALKMEVASSDDEEAVKKGEGPMWSLFDHLFNAASSSEHPNATGAPLGTSLWKLPYRRFHPEYFELIKRPISMCQIQTKLKKGDYANISDLTADLYLMLDNAKRAFPASHRTHKDAVKMLKIMNAKLVEEALDPDISDLDDDDSSCTLPKKKGRPRVNSSINSPTTISTINSCNTSPKCRVPVSVMMKKKILSIQKHLIDFAVGSRHPIELFMEKPQRKVYPDYYDIIQNPIDMTTIENNIRSDKYTTLEEVLSDYRLMFSNCRQYNEEGSPIYQDADILEKALNEKLKDFPGVVEIKKNILKNKSVRRKDPLIKKLWTFFETIRDYQEPKGKRQLSLIFTKLPSKGEYPDYYDIIGDPIDMEKISQKLKQNSYESLDDLAADLLLMLENACKYNEPDSQIYKDALVLQQLTMQTKQLLRDGDEEIPDVPLAVQELLVSLFTSLYNHQDEEGRCFSDSLAELPEYDEISGDTTNGKLRGISFDLIKRRLDKGVYKRLDVFQEDVFSCLDRARKLSRSDTDIFQDAVELQSYYIQKRDMLCKDTLSSKALKYTLSQLSYDISMTRKTKHMQEEQDQEEEDKAATQGESMTIDQKVFSPGDFVYFDVPENKIPGIAYIERLWSTDINTKMMQGCVFLRPYETYHVTTRKFLEQEVFKSNQSVTLPLDKILNKCYVMHVKDFIRFKPEGFADKDVFVCESRYNIRARCFKKFKNWPYVRENDPVKFLQRNVPLELKRVMSVFKERVEKHKGELAELKLHEALIIKDKPNVECSTSKNNEQNIVYYEQYNTVCGGVVKTGDFVYVATQTGKQSIVHIHSIWESSNKSYIQGPWLLTPSEIPPSVAKTFYRQELFLSSVKEVSPTIAIVGRCAVLEYHDYIISRPTEISESDIFICESLYDEYKKVVRKLSSFGGLRKFTHSTIVTEDEIFYFKSAIKPIKGNLECKDSKEQFDIKCEGNEGLNVLEDSLDGEPLSVNSDVILNASPIPSTASTPFSLKTKSNRTHKAKVVTGYILYSCEVRKGICQSNPDASFGDISRMVGNEWKNLPASVKQNWEDKANKINEEAVAKSEEQNLSKSPAPSENSSSLIYECLWEKCDYQFEDAVDCMEHCIQDGTGHLQKKYQSQSTDIEYHCLWKGCIRMKKSMAAFPQLQRLIKHVREVHLSKGGRLIPLSERSNNFVPRKNPLSPQYNSSCPSVVNSNNNGSNRTFHQLQNQGLPLEPQFVTVPPRPQRVLHSEAYIRYIEGLQNNAAYIGLWKKSLHSNNSNQKSANCLTDNTEGSIEDVTKSLWQLRNFLLNDVLY